MSNAKAVLGIIAGASIGAMLGILLAPDKGSATRKKIIDHTNDLRSLLNDWTTDFIASIKNGDTVGDSKQYNATSRVQNDPEMMLNTMG